MKKRILSLITIVLLTVVSVVNAQSFLYGSRADCIAFIRANVENNFFSKPVITDSLIHVVSYEDNTTKEVKYEINFHFKDNKCYKQIIYYKIQDYNELHQGITDVWDKYKITENVWVFVNNKNHYNIVSLQKLSTHVIYKDEIFEDKNKAEREAERINYWNTYNR